VSSEGWANGPIAAGVLFKTVTPPPFTLRNNKTELMQMELDPLMILKFIIVV
jgi:hypothetical protein